MSSIKYMDVIRTHRVNRKSIIHGLIAGILVCAVVIGTLAIGINTTISNNYQDEIVNLSDELVEKNQELAVYDAKLMSQMQSFDEAIDKMVDVSEDPASVFAVLNKYTYVFPRVQSNGGFTVGVMVYGDKLCQEHDIKPHWLWEVITCESYFDKNAMLASTNARGLGGFLESSGKWVYEDLMGNGKGTYDHDMAYDPYIAIEMMVFLLDWMKDEYNGNLEKMINHYSGDPSGAYYRNLVSIASSDGVDIYRSTYK